MATVVNGSFSLPANAATTVTPATGHTYILNWIHLGEAASLLSLTSGSTDPVDEIYSTQFSTTFPYPTAPQCSIILPSGQSFSVWFAETGSNCTGTYTLLQDDAITPIAATSSIAATTVETVTLASGHTWLVSSAGLGGRSVSTTLSYQSGATSIYSLLPGNGLTTAKTAIPVAASGSFYFYNGTSSGTQTSYTGLAMDGVAITTFAGGTISSGSFVSVTAPTGHNWAYTTICNNSNCIPSLSSTIASSPNYTACGGAKDAMLIQAGQTFYFLAPSGSGAYAYGGVAID